MLSFFLIGGLVWLVMALVFVVALAAAARPQSAPSPVVQPVASEMERAEYEDSVSDEDGLLSSESPVPT